MSSSGIEASISPLAERLMSLYPVYMILMATSRAIIGSITTHPVNFTTTMPAITPAEVHTSVIRCLPSASRISDLCFLPLFMSMIPTTMLTSEARRENNKPVFRFSSGTGSISRVMAERMMLNAAIRMSAPSAALEKYSALVWPNA